MNYTQISIKKLTFEDIIDCIICYPEIILVIIGSIGVCIAVITLGALLYQIRKQNIVRSAEFMTGYVEETLEKNKQTIDELIVREKDLTKNFKSDKSVRVLLNRLENIIQFGNDGIIDKKHLLNTLHLVLKGLKNDTEVQRIIKETQIDKPDAFTVVVKFMNNEIPFKKNRIIIFLQYHLLLHLQSLFHCHDHNEDRSFVRSPVGSFYIS